MKNRLFQKTLFAVLAILILFSFASCSKNEETKTSPLTADETKTAEEIVSETWDLLGKVEIFCAKSETGNLTKPGESSFLDIESEEDFAPYRDLFSELDDAKLQTALSDTAGRLILMESVQKTEGFSYSCNSVARYEGVIEICFSEADDAEAEKHQYFLFYFPSDIYRLEDIRILVV